MSNFEFAIHFKDGVENDYRTGDLAVRMFDRDFSAYIRKYSMFKGEQDLNIFNKKEAMQYLVETFSQIRDFDPYQKFMEYAQDTSQTACDHAMKADRRNSKEAERLSNLIRAEERTIHEYIVEKRTKDSEAENFRTLLENAEKNKDASTTLVDVNKRISKLEGDRDEELKKLNENYTIRLLDEMWILMGFAPVAEEFRKIVGELDRSRRKMQSDYDRKIGAEKLVKTIQSELSCGHVPLAINVPDENTMREMIDEEFCKVCGRPAPKDTEPYNYMKRRLNEFLAAQGKLEEEEEETPELFRYDFIRELNDMYSVLHNNTAFLKGLDGYIDRTLMNNFRIRTRIDALNDNIEKEVEQKKKILAQTDGASEDDLLSNYQNISQWYSSKLDAENRSLYLSRQIENHKRDLEGYREDYSKISQDSLASIYSRTATALRLIKEAFDSAKVTNRRAFLNQLEEEANGYLRMLNKGDFKGTIRILEKPDDSAETILVDSDSTRIYNPNTALKTTMYMSLLFAVAKLTSLKHDEDYPLIFDAPTSSFTGTKESDFFSVIAGIEKQTIIVTKSFLVEGPDKKLVLDRERLSKINGCKYQIKKKEPYNDEDLSTIETVVKPIN